MFKMKKLAAALLVSLALVMGVSGTALADIDGAYGLITLHRVNSAGSQTYSYYRHNFTIGGDTYFSGGSYCTGVPALSASEVDLLAHYFINGVRINPYYLLVNGNRCLTIFSAY